MAFIAGSTAPAESLKVLALSSEPFFYDDGGEHAGIEYDVLVHELNRVAHLAGKGRAVVDPATTEAAPPKTRVS